MTAIHPEPAQTLKERLADAAGVRPSEQAGQRAGRPGQQAGEQAGALAAVGERDGLVRPCDFEESVRVGRGLAIGISVSAAAWLVLGLAVAGAVAALG